MSILSYFEIISAPQLFDNLSENTITLAYCSKYVEGYLAAYHRGSCLCSHHCALRNASFNKLSEGL